MKNEKLNKEGRATIELMVADGIISKECAEKYFPELKESEDEDEAIRKELYESIRISNPKEVADKYIAFLEMQCKQKPVWNDEDDYLLDETIKHLAILVRITKKQGSAYSDEIQYYQRSVEWLKSIKDRVQPQPKQEADLEKVFNDEYSKFSNDTDAMDYALPIDLADYREFAKQFFDLGVKTQKG